jgi:hypothetical protein
LVSASTITLTPSENVGNEYIFNDPNGYSNALVTVTFNSVMNNFAAHISATGLKPGFAYQVKLLGTPACAGGSDAVNEKIGYSGRWYCPLCGSDPNANNRNDAQYEACKVNPSCTECIYGYLIFDYFTADANGNAEVDVTTDASYHVLWCDASNVDLYFVDKSQSPFKDNTLKCTDPKLCHSYDVIGETERASFSELPEGTYSDVKIALTEESFHQACGTWATVLEQSLSFTINKLDDGNGNFLLDDIDVGNPTSESGHLDMQNDGWSYIGDNDHDGNGYLKLGGYGGYDNDANFRGLMGPPTGCSASDTWATFTLDAGDGEAVSLVIRHLDGSQGDSFDVCIVEPAGDNCFATYTADGTSSEDWKTTIFNLPEGLSGEIKFKLKATDPQTPWCDLGWGQVMINWIHLYGNNQSNVPEFSSITAAIALVGAVAGLVVLRKHK